MNPHEPLGPQLDHLPVPRRQPPQRLVNDELEEGEGRRVAVGRPLGTVRGPLLAPHVAAGGPVEGALVAYLVEGDHQEQPPQLLADRHVVVAAAGAAEEAAED